MAFEHLVIMGWNVSHVVKDRSLRWKNLLEGDVKNRLD